MKMKLLLILKTPKQILSKLKNEKMICLSLLEKEYLVSMKAYLTEE